MSTPSGAMPGTALERPAAAPALPETRPFYWSVRRELWENRSITLAPLVVAAVMLFGFSVSMTWLPHRRRALLLLDPARQAAAIQGTYAMPAGLLLITAFVVAFFYCLDALYGERRDRSILFWKSLPVSDVTTVLAKAAIPIAVLPAVIFVVITATQVVMLLMSSLVLAMSGLHTAASAQWELFPSPVRLLYAMVVMALWHAPIYAWLLLVSAWARRAVFLWAVLPFFGISVFERIAFHTGFVGSLIRNRLVGWSVQASELFQPNRVPSNPLQALDPATLLRRPGLWLGLAAAGVLLAAAVRLRRSREPI